MTYRYANDTTVSVSKSRDEIQRLLERFGATQMQWSDDFERGRAQLRFAWKHETTTYLARFDVQLPTNEKLRELALDGRSRRFSQKKFDKLRARRGMVEHRELMIFLKAAFLAVQANIIKPEQLFLAWLEGADGVTVAERIIPRLTTLLNPGGSKALLKAVEDD